MKGPNKPTVQPSEPEIERMLAKSAINKVKNDGFDGIQVYLPYLESYLQYHSLTLDNNGYIIHQSNGEHAVPYVFVDDLVCEKVKGDNESFFDAFFRPVTHEKVHGWNEERIHATDLHSVIKTDDGKSHPIRDGVFEIGDMHASLESRFKIVTGWSDIVKKHNIDENGQWLGVAKGFDESNKNNTLNINCMNPDCGYSGEISSWNGNEHTDPECPECDGKWDSDGISLCTICGSWYWGRNYQGETIYAEPVCANCGEDMEYIERITRYDDINSFEQVIEDNRPNYSIVGLNDNGEKEYVFDYCESKDEADKRKEISEKTSSVAFDEVEEVVIREMDDRIDINHIKIQEN